MFYCLEKKISFQPYIYFLVYSMKFAFISLLNLERLLFAICCQRSIRSNQNLFGGSQVVQDRVPDLESRRLLLHLSLDTQQLCDPERSLRPVCLSFLIHKRSWGRKWQSASTSLPRKPRMELGRAGHQEEPFKCFCSHLEKQIRLGIR